MSVAETEHDEGKPAEEEQAVEQRTSRQASCDAEQRTFGSHGSKQDGKEDNGIDGGVTPELRVAESSAKGKDSALLYHALHHQAAECEHHQSAVQAVAHMTEEPTKPFVIEDASARYT